MKNNTARLRKRKFSHLALAFSAIISSPLLVSSLMAQGHGHPGGGGTGNPTPGPNTVAYKIMDYQPQRIESVGGILTADLIADYADVVVGGKTLHVRTFNGKMPGPTFVASPGDTMNIKLINRLPPQPPMHGPPDGNFPHDFNTLNLHTHGLNVSPEGKSDNVLLEIPPQTYLPYSIQIPSDHPSGTFLYHPHKHGSVTAQMGSGMVGTILIKGGLDDIPEIAAAKEVQLVVKQLTLLPDGTVPNEMQLFDLSGAVPMMDQITVNGLAIDETAVDGHAIPPEIDIQPGEVQRWRITVASTAKFFKLRLQGGSMNLVAFDGITLPAVTPINDIVLASGNRADILVKAGNTPGVFPLEWLAYDQGFMSNTNDTTLVNMVVGGAAKDMPLPAQLNPPLARLPDITSAEIVKHRVVNFSLLDPFTPFVQFLINDKKFDHHRVDQTMELNTAEEWTLSSTDPLDEHPFHIHVNWFQVTAINGVPVVPPRWQDTVIIPRLGNVTIRHRFQKYAGQFVLHCHITAHEDLGMMSLVEVIDPNNLTPIQQWRKTHFGSPNNEGVGSDYAAGAVDGAPNIFKYAFGVPPSQTLASSGAVPQFGTTTARGQTRLHLPFPRLTAPSPDITYAVQHSSDLSFWTDIDIEDNMIGLPVPQGTIEKVTVGDLKPFSAPDAAPTSFLRVGVMRSEVEATPIGQ